MADDKRKHPWRRCAGCTARLTRKNASMDADLCIFCCALKLHEENKALKAAAGAAKSAALRESDMSENITDVHAFGGFEWGHANVCPVG